jgi:hypothetical protein
MLARLIFVFPSIVCLTIAGPALAEGKVEQGGNEQSPIQVIVSIVLTAIVLRVLGIFKLP